MLVYDVMWMDDEWTVVTEDLSLLAHYENTILITNGEPEIFSRADEIKQPDILSSSVITMTYSLYHGELIS